jgi:DNA-binding SARP family transcriptional activator/tetratricopeptide (TPR) repeat protein
MEFRLLGPVEAETADRTLDVGHARQRAVLAVLLLDLGRVVSADQLIDRIWDDEPPASARNVLYGHLARLKSALAGSQDPGVSLARRAGGYRLHVDPDRVDLHRFRGLVAAARTAGYDDQAAKLLRRALDLWRGQPLAGLHSSWLDAVRSSLELERTAAARELTDIRLRLGEHHALAAELAIEAAAAPIDERLIGQVMLALYRSGQKAEALRWFDRTRRQLAAELGADPAPPLQTLYQQVLRADPALDPPGRSATAATAVVALGVPVPRQLPGDVPAFTGREGELAALAAVLDGHRRERCGAVVISAIAGTAGVGKTGLAVHWAHRIAERFPDGQLYVNLRGFDPGPPVSPTDALTGFLRALGVAGADLPEETEELGARYRSLLAAREMLIVLDNARDANQVRPLLPGSGTCLAVVTSRDTLAGLVARDGARRVDLDVLPMPDAVRLLRELIGPRARAEQRAAEALAERCCRLPLALRIAAEFAAARPELPLAQLADELTDQQRQLDLLDAEGDQATAARVVFSWSYRQLDAPAARAFRLFGLHPGPDFELNAAGALTGTTVRQARALAEALARASLIQSDRAGRYSMHDLLRAYAREQTPAGEAGGSARAALNRLFDYYRASASAAMDILYPAEAHLRPRVPASAGTPALAGPQAARAWLDRELANLVAVTGHCAAHGWPRHAIDLAALLFRYLLVSDTHLPEALTIYTHALRAGTESGDVHGQAVALNGLGGVSLMKGHFRAAADHYRGALDRYRQCGDRVGEARVLHNLASTESNQHDYASAARHCQQAIAAYDAAGEGVGRARALTDLAECETELGSYHQAAEHLELAIPVLRQANDHVHEAQALERIGQLSLHLSRLAEAATAFQESLAAYRSLRHPTGVATQLCNLGEVSLRAGDGRRAIGYFRQALPAFRESGYQHGEIIALRSLGQALQETDDPAAAYTEFVAAIDLAAQTGNAYQQASAHRDLAESHYAVGQHEAARRQWELALSLFDQVSAPEANEIRVRLDALDSEQPP